MPCLFFRNVPAEVEFKPVATGILFQSIVEAADVAVAQVEVHIEDTQYQLLKQDGRLCPSNSHGIHVFVEWYQGRSPEARDRIAKAIHHFLLFHGLGKGSNITFRDYPISPAARSFYYEGKRIT